MTAIDDIRKWSRKNWDEVPKEHQDKCLELLSAEIHLTNRDVLKSIMGDPDANFHHGAGMDIRNLLRKVLKDDQLPGIKYPVASGNTETVRNWDDYYMGALDHFLEIPKSEPDTPIDPTNIDPELNQS